MTRWSAGRFAACFAMLAALSACATDKEDKYELRSPCVAAEGIITDGPTPCARRPANPYHPYAKISPREIV